MEKTIQDRKVEVLDEMRRQMNGVVADALRPVNAGELLTYGVSVPTIRTIARSYAPDHALALAMFPTNVRELKLAAVYVADASQMDADQLNHWRERILTTEVADHLGMELLHRIRFLDEVLHAWIGGDDPLAAQAALKALGKALLTQQQPFPASLCTEAVATACRRFGDRKPVLDAAVFLLVRLAKTHAENRAVVEGFLASCLAAGGPAEEYIRREAGWQLAY